MSRQRVDSAERCPCGHAWDEHDAMGDCHHEDRRTSTGYCEKCWPSPPEETEQ